MLKIWGTYLYRVAMTWLHSTVSSPNSYGIKHLQLVLGWSMGAEQTYEWAVRFSNMVKRALHFAGTAKTTDLGNLVLMHLTSFGGIQRNC